MATVKKQFSVERMHCGACATGIQMYLSNTDGVTSVSVDYNAKKADVEYDDAKINEAGIKKAVEELGYKFVG